jgi:hypothetical protein
VLSAVKDVRVQSAHRSRRFRPASLAIRSSSEGHTKRCGAERPGRSVLDPVAMRDQPLVHQVEGVEPQMVLTNMEGPGGLSRWQPL